MNSLSGNRFIIAFPEGELDFYKVDRKLYKVCGPKMYEHSSSIISISYNEKFDMLLTTANDRKVKLWTSDKYLIREIVFPQKVDGVCMLDTGHIIAVHNGILSKVHYQPLQLMVDLENYEEEVTEEYF